MDKTPKPKTTLKEIRRKMKKMTLAEKKQVKEEKEQQKQKEKESKQKQKITQRVKININIPSQKTSSPQIQNPFSSSNIDQINLLKAISEQLKKKDEPKKTAENFNIPVKQQSTQTFTPSQEIETQTEPKKQSPQAIFDIPELIKPFRLKEKTPSSSNSSIGSYTPTSYDSLSDNGSFITPNSLSFFPNLHSDSSLASSIKENILDKIQKRVNEKVRSENIKKKDEALSIKKLDELNQKQQKLINEEIKKKTKEKKIDENMKQLGDAFKKDELINQVKQIEKIPLIDKPKDTSNLNLLEKVKEGSKESYFSPTPSEFSKDFDEVVREFESLYEVNPDDYIEIDKGQQEIEDELQGFSPKVTNPLIPPQDTTGESLLEKVKRGRGRPRKTEEEKQQTKENAKEKKRREKEESERSIREQDYFFKKKL